MASYIYSVFLLLSLSLLLSVDCNSFRDFVYSGKSRQRQHRKSHQYVHPERELQEKSKSSASDLYIVVLNALDKSALEHAISLKAKIESYNLSPGIQVKIFGKDRDIKDLKEKINLESSEGITAYRVLPAPDLSLSRGFMSSDRKFIRQYYEEQVSYILDSLLNTLDMGTIFAPKLISSQSKKDNSASSKESYLLSLTMNNKTIMHINENFSKIFQQFNDRNNEKRPSVMLLSRVERLHSYSDWADLMVFGLEINNRRAQQWLKDVVEVYVNHTRNRQCCTLLDPRPAILESNTRLAVQNLSHMIYYFQATKDVCISNVDRKSNENHICQSNSPAAISLTCKNLENGQINRNCLNLEGFTDWRHFVGRDIPNNYQNRFNEARSKLAKAMWLGSLQFRNATDKRTPRKFCWDESEVVSAAGDLLSGVKRVDTKIYNSWNNFTTFEHKKQKRANISVVLLSGSPSGQALDNSKYVSMTKQYYAKAHGYKFTHALDFPFKSYYHHSILGNTESPGFGNIGIHYVPKILTILETAYLNPHHDWILWTDDDVWINPTWIYLPFDAFLKDVPEDKVVVITKYRTGFTNIIGFRNNRQGRQFLRDWVAVYTSGLIECHGFDQAAFQLLTLQRLHGSMHPYPFNFSCIYSENGLTGCNSKGDYSCDFKFEAALYFAGFKTVKQDNYFNLKISSFTKGCANDIMTDVYLVDDNSERPRLHCGHCTRLDRIEASGHWDGPLGGGNDKLRKGAVNSWFFNHKGQFLLYEAYLDHLKCKKLDFIDDCDMLVHDTSTSSNQDFDVNSAKHLISLADGLAYDIINEQFCRVTHGPMLKHQWTNTYMKDYPALIELANSYTQEKWDLEYKNNDGAEGRCHCEKVGDPSCHPDTNQKDNYYVHNEGNENNYYEDGDYCKKSCKVVPIQNPGKWSGRLEKVVDCRSDKQIEQEKTYSQDTLQHLLSPWERGISSQLGLDFMAE